jgi:glycosyltransferase involved in cell wall biosynthesis
MRAGLPVVATDVGGVREAVSDGETGFLTPCGDRDALAEKLGKLVAEPQLRAEMGIRGRRLYEQHFTFQRMYRETLALYRTVLEERSDRGK